MDAILNISKRSTMPEWHQLDSSSTMPQQQESTKKKTLKSSSRLFWFSTGLIYVSLSCFDYLTTKAFILSVNLRQFVQMHDTSKNNSNSKSIKIVHCIKTSPIQHSLSCQNIQKRAWSSCDFYLHVYHNELTQIVK